jgi:mannonate dehydratase
MGMITQKLRIGEISLHRLTFYEQEVNGMPESCMQLEQAETGLKIGDRFFLTGAFDKESLTFVRQLGAEGAMVNIGGELKGNSEGTRAVTDDLVHRLQSGPYWNTRDLVDLRQAIEAFGLELFCIGHVPPHRFQKVLLGLPGRDEEIDNWCKSLRAMGEAGIPILQYMWDINIEAQHGIRHTRTSANIPLRGGALGKGFDYGLIKDAPVTALGIVSDDRLWESLTYFLKAVIPAAEMAGVRMAMHPSDPQVPSLAGIARIMRSPEAFDRLLSIVPSTANAINFCQGCFAQMLEPDDVYQAIKHFASLKAIAFVHLRNVVGNRENFFETFWDDGKIDMAKAVRLYCKAGYEGYITSDHHPHVIGDTVWGHRSRAFALGYLRGLVQSSNYAVI